MALSKIEARKFVELDYELKWPNQNITFSGALNKRGTASLSTN